LIPTLISALLAVLWLVIPGASEKIELAALVTIVLGVALGGGIAANGYSISRGNVKGNATILEVERSITSTESIMTPEQEAMNLLASEIRLKATEFENKGGDLQKLLKIEPPT
ncbi:MAG: hypothetical protein KKH61_21105, partial [Gammaproteobacteria bacterium]|nr:hypothetical protein [Gammaproteobacteria bacterium]